MYTTRGPSCRRARLRAALTAGLGYGPPVRIVPASPKAAEALNLVTQLQLRFAERLTAVNRGAGGQGGFEAVSWLRDEGRHGGGERLVAPTGGIFDRGSVNVSQVHYDDEPAKRLASATALSTIIHPKAAHAPSVHIHVSWTELRDGSAYWRVMADLNPAIPHESDKLAFAAALQDAAPGPYEEAAAQGDRYFYIPALQRHRGVTHFYLESYATGDPAADEALAERVTQAAIDTYTELLEPALARQASDADQLAQLEYHTLYLFQVLTLDRGTTSGLLVHAQNDVGIMGSLPSHVNGALLASWADRVPQVQRRLVEALSDVVGRGERVPVHAEQKVALAQAVRAHYQAHPEALKLQASGDVVPPTVDNHR